MRDYPEPTVRNKRAKTSYVADLADYDVCSRKPARVSARGVAFSDATAFFRTFASVPWRMGAIAPSGRALATIITSELSPFSAPVIELGPGTGVFTREIVARGVPEEQLVLIESDVKFSERLRHSFPGAAVHQLDATRLSRTRILDGNLAGAVVSGLPLLLMSRSQVASLLSGILHHLRSDGTFYQFTYWPRCPIPPAMLERYGLRATCIGGTVANCPPAVVYRIERVGNPHSGTVHDTAARYSTRA